MSGRKNNNTKTSLAFFFGDNDHHGWSTIVSAQLGQFGRLWVKLGQLAGWLASCGRLRAACKLGWPSLRVKLKGGGKFDRHLVQTRKELVVALVVHRDRKRVNDRRQRKHLCRRLPIGPAARMQS